MGQRDRLPGSGRELPTCCCPGLGWRPVAEAGRQLWVPPPRPAPPAGQPLRTRLRLLPLPPTLHAPWAALGPSLWVPALSVPVFVSVSVCLSLPPSFLSNPVSVSHTPSLPQGRRQALEVYPTPCCTPSHHTALSCASHTACFPSHVLSHPVTPATSVSPRPRRLLTPTQPHAHSPPPRGPQHLPTVSHGVAAHPHPRSVPNTRSPPGPPSRGVSTHHTPSTPHNLSQRDTSSPMTSVRCAFSECPAYKRLHTVKYHNMSRCV